MVALGMLTFENGRYGNTEVAQVFLTGQGHDMRPLVRFWNRLSYPSWNGLVESVRKDGQKDAVFDFSPEDQALFSAGVEAASAGGGMALAASYDFCEAGARPRHRRRHGVVSQIHPSRVSPSGARAVRTARDRRVRPLALLAGGCSRHRDD
jgi:hypothetical protein